MITASTRFWSKVNLLDQSGCWLWLAAKDCGYGRFNVGGGVAVGAHRWAYEYVVGDVPEGAVLDHLCRNRACVNPSHLEPVTNRENILRGVGGSAVNAAKTHCIRGHELADYNLYVRKNGQRTCRTCASAAARRRYLARS